MAYNDEIKSLLQDGELYTDKSSEELVFNPFNPKNTEISENIIHSILQKYGINSKIHNLNLYKRAFVHRSYVKRPNLENIQNNITIVEKPFDCLPLKTKSNERLEFLGDGVLECIIKYYLYRRFPKANEGFMTEKKIALVKNETIGKFAYEIGLNKWYMISKHAEEKKTRTNLKKLGCLFEAFLGALFLDFNKIDVVDEKGWFQNIFKMGPGIQMAQIFVESVLEKHVNWLELIQNDDNYKNILQVKIQKEFKTTPIYLEIDKNEEQGYTMGVFLYLGSNPYNLNPKHAIHYKTLHDFKQIHAIYEEKNEVFVFFGKSIHKIKKKAEQVACQNAIKLLENNI